MIVVGADEVGRGALSGPLVVCAAAFELPQVTSTDWAAVEPEILLTACPVPGVKDSKRFSTDAARRAVAARITPVLARSPGFGVVTATEINRWRMATAWRVGFERAVTALALGLEPFIFLVDGDVPAPAHAGGEQSYMPKADNYWWPVAAASILAKVTRDAFMVEQASQFPAYGFDVHKGYGTAQHIAALREHGPCALHRTAFVRTALSPR